MLSQHDIVISSTGLITSSAQCTASAKALPPPLSKQEEAECIGALAAGDESMRRVLIERNLRLVRSS